MLNSVNGVRQGAERMLLLDTCGEGAGVALSAGETVLAMETLPRGGGSAEIVSAVEQVLGRTSMRLADVDAIGVVSGPGSFTGVRVGMAAAKGFAEATGVRMLTVSRLLVLGEAAAVMDGVVALDAGRGECYATERTAGTYGSEWLGSLDDLRAKASGREVVVAEEKLAVRLREMEPSLAVRVHPLQSSDALLPLLQLLREQSRTMVLGDANYLWRESDIYKKTAGRS